MTDVTARLRLVVDSSGVDKSGRSLKKLEKQSRRTEDAAKRLRAAYAGLAAVLGGLSVIKFFDAYNEQARAIAKVEQAIRSTAGAAGFAALELRKMASELQRTTLFGDERILNDVTAQLLTFTNITGEQFKRTQQVALDLATVLDGDLKSASISLGKALNDPVKNLSALSRSGIQFSKEQTEVIKSLAETNRLADAQTIILAELERQYGGQAEAAAAVGTGLLRQLQNVVGDVGELFGERLFKRIRPGIKAIYDFLTIDENAVTVVKIIESIGAALGVVAGVGAVSVLAGLLNPVTVSIVALGAALAGLVYFADDIAEWAFGVRDAGAVVQAAIDELSPAFLGVVNYVRPLIANFVNDAVELLQLLAASIQGLVGMMNEAVNRVQIKRLKSEYEDLARQQRELVNGLIEIQNLPVITPGDDLARELAEKELDKVNAKIAETRKKLQELLNPQEVGGLGGIFSEIRDRAQEIAEARSGAADVEERVTRQTHQTANEVGRLRAEYKKLKDEAAKASGNILQGAQDRIAGFEDNVRRADIGFAGPDAKQLAATLQKEFQQLVEDIDTLSIGLNQEQLLALYEALEDAGILLREKIEDGSRRGALGIGAAIRQALADGVGATADLINFGANIGRDIVSGIGGALDVIKDPLASLGDKILGGVESIANGLASIPGPIGAVAGAVASVAGLVKDIINLFKKPSDKTAQTVFNIFSGSVAGSADDNAPENAKLRDEIAETIRDFNRQIIGLTGATRGSNNPSTRANEAFINLAVRTDRSTGETFFDVGFQSPNGEQSGGGRFSTQAEAIDEAVRLSISTLRGGASDLLDIAQALANTDLGASEIIDSLNTIIELTDLGGEPLSEYQQRIKELNDIFDDAIRKVNGVAEAEAKLNSAREKAIQGVTRDFNRDIQEQIGGFLNGPLDELEKLLKSQEQRFEEASKLGADIAQVERLAALELRDFFEGLSDSALQEVQSFLGLFEEASNSVARNLDLSRQDLQSTRDFFAQSAQQFAQLRTDLTERFIAASPRESIGILQGRATDLLGQVREGNQSAAQALPQVLSQLIDSARQSFGNTKGFTEVFNFVQGILSDAEAASLAVVSDAERQIAALDESNVILSDIRDILSSSRAANAFFQSYSSGGIASADELLSLIQQGAGLTVASNDNAAALNITGLIAQSVVPIVMPIADSINVFTQRLADLPDLARQQIEATDRTTEAVERQTEDYSDGQERIESLLKRILAEMEEAA